VQDSDNSVLAVLSAEDGRLRVQGLLEVGEELGQPVPYPFAPPGQRWLYVPDTRDDRIYVVDVTSDVPTVRARIDGRAVRTLSSGRQILARTLATPLSIVFDRRGGRRFAYVTNFENSTLAVIDVSDDNPLQHCVVARFGRDRALDGSTEAEGATL
jgi:DNA-binding beta-propeller fold protein YncE